MKVKGFLSLALAFALSSAMVISASAAEGTDDSYGYRSGQQKNSERHAQYEQIASLSDADRKAFFEERGIDGEHSGDRHLDVDIFVEAGIIDQATADSIRQYASEKHAQLHDRYTGMENMTPEERHTRYASFDKNKGDSVDALLEAGILTQEQADAISAYLAE